jgi:ubiquitin C-terminal hydrolase
MGQNQFYEPDFRTGKKYTINNSYLKYPQFQLAINFDQIIEEKKKEKEEEDSKSKNELLSKSEIESASKISNFIYIYNSENNKLFNIDSFEKKYIEPIGIINKSIYCYMISCLQVLLSIPELNYYFLYKKYKTSDQKTLICDDYSDFISLYKYFQKTNKAQIKIPRSVYRICHSFLPKGVMNDCQEFYILFLKSIQEELNKKIKDIKENSNNEEIKNDIEKYWENYRSINNCFIDGLFCGLIRSTVICDKCQNETHNYEPFMDLAVPIPKKNKSIIRCLNIYFDYELIECDYHCGKCNAITNVRKYYIINNLIFNRSRKN